MPLTHFAVALAALGLSGMFEAGVHDNDGDPHDDTDRQSVPIEQVSMDELLRMLPPADTEWSICHQDFEFTEHPASVEISRRLKTEVLSDDQWRFVILHTRSICVRSKWPIGEPFAISMAVPRWLGLTQIRAEPRREGLRSGAAGELLQPLCGTTPNILYRMAKYQPLGELEPGHHTLDFDVTVERGRWFWGNDEELPEPGVIWEGTMRFEVEMVASIDDAVPPATDPELDAAVTASLGAGFREWHTSEGPRMTAFVNVDPDIARFPALERTALSLVVDVLRGDEVKQSGRLIASRWDTLSVSNSVSEGPLRLYGSANLGEVPPEIESEETELAKWSVRIRGTSDAVLALWDADQRWAGEVIVPLAELIDQEAARVGPGGRGPEVSTPSIR